MTQDSYVQVAPDSSGKKVTMEQITDAAGNVLYLQRALLVGDPADNIQQIVFLLTQQTAILRTILQVLRDSSNSRVLEEDFTQAGVNIDVYAS